MRSLLHLSSVTGVAILHLILLQPVLAQCSLDIQSVVGLGQPGDLRAVRVEGSAVDCARVEVRLYCSRDGGSERVDVDQGSWELVFNQAQADRAGCACLGRIALDAICSDGKMKCEDEARQTLDCRPDEAPPGFQYAATFVCGKPEKRVAAPGAYFTAITVHNPADMRVSFRKKFATALPDQKPGPVTRFFPGRLGPDEALEIDCPEILERAGRRDGFLKGFAVIESDVELDVIVVYSAAGSDGTVESLEIERVPARRRGRCSGPDLIVEMIEKPAWDGTNRRSVIRARISNVGNAPAGPSTALVRDPSTIDQGSQQPYEMAVPVMRLGPGDGTMVTFYLPYWVYNPDASLEVTADYKRVVDECDEENNVKSYNDLG